MMWNEGKRNKQKPKIAGEVSIIKLLEFAYELASTVINGYSKDNNNSYAALGSSYQPERDA